MKTKQKFLIVVDGSYWLYATLFGAVKDFIDKCPDIASYWIKPAEECDQKSLPDLTACHDFLRVLKKYVMKRVETVESLAKQNFQNEIDSSDQIDIVFAMDDRLKNNFRLKLYPQYKAQRQLVKHSYQIQPIKDYIVNVLFKELDIESNRGFTIVKVDGAEGDDVIATVLMNYRDKYIGSMLIASDHDFLQIDGVREFDLFGKEAHRTLSGEEVSAEDFLLGKILMGDKSDNISQVFLRCGPKTALKWTKNKDALKSQLQESQEAAERYRINKKIISFKEIPEELSKSIVKTLNEKLYSDDVLNPATDLGTLMSL